MRGKINLLSLILMLCLAGAVSALTEVWVDDDYTEGNAGEHTFGSDAFSTIQEGVDAVDIGGTVHVAAGIYDECSITIDKPITLLGSQANIDPRPSQEGRTGDESIVDGNEGCSAIFIISADDVEINGVTITGGTGDMVEESGSANNLLFQYNILYDDLESEGDEGIQIKYSDNVTIQYNYAYNILQDAFNIAASSNSVIRYNEAHDIYSENAAIYCYDETNIDIIGNLIYNVPNNDGIKLGDSGDGSAGGTVKDNVVYDIAEDGITIYATDVTVENNEIYNCSSENGALYLYGADESTIKDNNIHDNNAIGILIKNSQNIDISGNDIYNNNDSDDTKYQGSAGIWVTEDASECSANYNNIYNNADYGLKNEFASTMDAENNYWGTADGPSGEGSGTGDAVSENVDYFPWCTNDECTEFANSDLSTVVVDDDWTEYSNYQEVEVDGTKYYYNHNAFSTIQEGIDAASNGGTINVAAGPYEEDITVDKSLTLEGAQVGVDARGRTATESEIVGVVEVTSDATNVIFDGFKFTSPTRAFTPRGFNLHIESESSTIKNNIFVAEENEGHTYSAHLDFVGIANAVVEYNDFSGDYDAIQIPNVIKFESVSGTVTAENNEMHDVGGGGGIALLLPDENAVFNINDNIIDHTGDGMWLWGTEDITLSIEYNSIYNNDAVHGNVGQNIDTGVKLAGYGTSSDIDVHYNNIYDNNLGMTNTGALVIDAENNYWGTADGPSGEGSGTGDNVSENVDYKPWYIDSARTMLLDDDLDEDQTLADEADLIVDETTTEIVVPVGSPIQDINVPSTVTEEVSLDLSLLLNVENEISLTNSLTLKREVTITEGTIAEYTADIPEETIITGDPDWNGSLTLPTVKNNTDYTAPSGSVEIVIDIGSGSEINFSKAVKIVMSGQAGKKAAWSRGTVLTDITTVCDNATNPTNIYPDEAPKECYIDDENNLLIWTYHFTKFAAYTPAPPAPPAPPTGGSSSGGRKIKIITPIPTPEEPEEITEEEPTETEKLTPTETPTEKEEEPTEETPTSPGGFATITGFFSRRRAGISSLAVLVVGFGLFLFSQLHGGLPGANHFTRATNFHKRAEKAHRKGKHQKSEKLYKKGQLLREKGEKRLR